MSAREHTDSRSNMAGSSASKALTTSIFLCGEMAALVGQTWCGVRNVDSLAGQPPRHFGELVRTQFRMFCKHAVGTNERNLDCFEQELSDRISELKHLRVVCGVRRGAAHFWGQKWLATAVELTVPRFKKS